MSELYWATCEGLLSCSKWKSEPHYGFYCITGFNGYLGFTTSWLQFCDIKPTNISLMYSCWNKHIFRKQLLYWTQVFCCSDFRRCLGGDWHCSDWVSVRPVTLIKPVQLSRTDPSHSGENKASRSSPLLFRPVCSSLKPQKHYSTAEAFTTCRKKREHNGNYTWVRFVSFLFSLGVCRRQTCRCRSNRSKVASASCRVPFLNKDMLIFFFPTIDLHCPPFLVHHACVL